LLELRKFAADDLVQNCSKLSATHQPDAFLDPRVDPVVLLSVHPQRVQRFLGDADLTTDAHDCRPVDNWHSADKRARGDREK
jgi:hypothetical protein